MNRCLPFIIFLCIPFFSFSQLTGIYTIGGNSPDFSTITFAVNALINQGIDSTVIFNIRNGTYKEKITIGYYSGFSSINTVTFQSESGDADSVIITDSLNNNTVVISEGYINFRNLTIRNFNNNSYTFNGGGMNSIELQNCTISGNHYSITLDYISSLKINNCSFFGESWIDDIQAFFLSGNFFAGDFSFASSSVGTIANSTFTGNVDFDANQSTIYLCSIGGNLSISYLNSNTIKNSFIGNGINISFSNGTKIYYNEIIGGISNSFSDYSKIVGNKIKGQVSISFSNYCNVFNNFIYDKLRISQSEYSKVYNNSFGTAAEVQVLGGNCDYINNILPQNTWGYVTSNLFRNNNFYPTIPFYDLNPFNFDPMFSGPDDLHSNNLYLFGKGQYLPDIFLDIDSSTRHNPPGIGANEICINTDIIDTINVPCGDSMFLSLCNLPDNGSFYWFPVSGLNDPESKWPKVSADTPVTYVITDSVSGYSDSIRLNTIPFQVTIFSVDSAVDCASDDSIQLTATPHATANYLWSPADGLNNANIQNPKARPQKRTNYSLTAMVTGCGSSYDEYMVFVDSTPVAMFGYMPPYSLDVLFNNQSLCADSFMWIFGDGDSSSEVNPSHLYPNCGIYSVSLIANNDYSSHIFTGAVNLTNIPPQPKVDLTIDNYTVIFNNLTTCAQNYFWNFGDGNTSDEEDPIHIFATEGQFYITLLVDGYGGSGYWDTIIQLSAGEIGNLEKHRVMIYYSTQNNFIIIQTNTFSKDHGYVTISNMLGVKLFNLDLSSPRQIIYLDDIKTIHNGLFCVTVYHKNNLYHKIISVY